MAAGRRAPAGLGTAVAVAAGRAGGIGTTPPAPIGNRYRAGSGSFTAGGTGERDVVDLWLRSQRVSELPRVVLPECGRELRGWRGLRRSDGEVHRAGQFLVAVVVEQPATYWRHRPGRCSGTSQCRCRRTQSRALAWPGRVRPGRPRGQRAGSAGSGSPQMRVRVWPRCSSCPTVTSNEGDPRR